MTTTPVFDEVRIARLHLRFGMLPLAHAELEELAGREALDATGLAALAEARWRSGDLAGADVAATACLDGGCDDPVAIVIAAEAAAADGRPGVARRLAARLAGIDASGLDAIYRGMPHRAFWPEAPGGASDDGTLFGGRIDLASVDRSADAAAVAAHAEAHAAELHAHAPGGPGHEHAHAPGHHLHAEPAVELALAREELGADVGRACLRLALVLRSDPAFAPAVIEALAMRKEPAAAVVRGDAQRLLGRHLEAEAAYAQAAAGLGRGQ